MEALPRMTCGDCVSFQGRTVCIARDVHSFGACAKRLGAEARFEDPACSLFTNQQWKEGSHEDNQVTT